MFSFVSSILQGIVGNIITKSVSIELQINNYVLQVCWLLSKFRNQALYHSQNMPSNLQLSVYGRYNFFCNTCVL